ncbi:MAG: hypothetical protein JO366_17555 [Methylobacteriaceae bacterium]|nr:hypothetical protein [Methylobacteriaceae bacterium]MBV9246606.1 hypothetical protein [Methylobacteriaceae bacterium]MBV9635196.1 hypothetical protein [Methylobacteriaceae bacterium]MBV9703197.1 hypothetical protein [Methylobacteriaceae bacterium]
MQRLPATILCALPLLVGSMASAPASSCAREVGIEQAKEMVGECLQVSPATHPPCNVSNSCSLIQSEIVRGCEMLDADKPDFCDNY